MGVVHKVVRKAASLESQMVANRRAAPPSPPAAAPAPSPVSSSTTAVSKYPRFGRRGAPQVSAFCNNVVGYLCGSLLLGLGLVFFRFHQPCFLAQQADLAGQIGTLRLLSSRLHAMRLTERACQRPLPPPAITTTGALSHSSGAGFPLQALRDSGGREPRHHRMDCNREGLRGACVFRHKRCCAT